MIRCAIRHATEDITIYRKWLIRGGHVCNHFAKKIPVAQEYNTIKACLIEHVTFINSTAFPIGPIKEN